MREGPECPTCAYAKVHACWPPAMLRRHITHCKTCHQSWGGLVRCHCTLCHETFATYGVSDHHWIKDGHVQVESCGPYLRMNGIA